jgi:predicted nuclease of predicted toxin-antitoxin system
MEYTITLPDSPSAIAQGGEGAFLNPFRELGDGPPVAPQLATGLPSCHHAGGAEGKSSACPHRQICYQILGEWYVRHGKYQRPDVTSYDRLDIAQRFQDPDRPWGEVVGMAREYDLSRTTIYDIAERVSVLLKPRLPGPAPCLKQLLPCRRTLSQLATETRTPSRAEEEHTRGRLILTSVFPGGVTMRPLEDILEEAPLAGRSDTTVWRLVNEAGAKAYQILTQVDYASVSLPVVLVEVDETFFDGRPILFVVEPISLALCGFHVPADGDRSSYTWGPLLSILQEDQHLDIYGGVGDAAKPYPGTFKDVLEQNDRFQEDTFHQLRDLQALRRKLENSAYRVFAAEYKAANHWQEEGTAEAQEQLHQAQAESLRLAELHDDFAEYSSWVADAFEIVDLRSGEVRDRKTNEWLLNQAIVKMSQLKHPDVVQMSERLDRHEKRLLTYLDWLDERLAPMRAELHTYLDDPELEKVVLRAVARQWRLQHEVESMQRRAFRPSLKHAEQELAIWVEGDPFLEQWSDQARMLLELVQRASSAAENVNSIFKPLVTRKKHFDNTDTNLNFVALFALWHNLRVFKEGKRKGYSPFDILGIDLGERDWRTLLGYPPAH